MSRRILAWSLFLAFFVLTAHSGVRDARAAGANDKEVEGLVESVLTSDYVTGNFKQALDQLELGKQACSTANACTPKIKARLYIAVGTVLAGGLKKSAEAKEAFATALKEDPTIGLFDDFITPEVQKAFNDARSGTSASGGTEETKKGPEQREPKKKWPGSGRPPRGWKSAEAFFYYNEATKSEGKRDWLDCVDYAQASLTAENRATTRFLAASCEEKAGLWIEAYADYQTVGETGGKSGLFDVANNAKQRAQTLKDKIPKIVLRKPALADNLVVKMNDVEVPNEKLNGEIWVNPGQRAVKATGKVQGVDLEFEQAVDATEFETTTVDIKLGPKGAKGDEAMKRCMLGAQTRDDFAKCLNRTSSSGPSLTIHFGTELSGYHDTDHVDVISPALLFGVENPTGGWGLGGSFILDVVTAASTDIVATASPRWRETRYAPAVSGHKKFGAADLGLHGNISREPDYLATSLGASFAIDVANKRVTPNLGYEFSYDLSGRSGTPFSVYSHAIFRNSIDAGASIVLDKATVLTLSANAIIEIGDSSKPYRHIPLFQQNVIPLVPPGFSIKGVKALAIPFYPYEQVPTNRQRYALTGLIAHRFSSSTIRAEERLYTDSWGLKASTTELLYFIDVSERLRLWPQARFNIQSGATFWRLAYPVQQKTKDDPTQYLIPDLRAGDRELGPLMNVTLGANARIAFGEKKNWALTFSGDAVYTRFFKTLYILDRLGIFGATTLEVDIE